MNLEEVLKELEALGTDRTKKIYMGQGAKEPLFGVATGAMKPIAKKIKGNQALAEELYATRNFDAMYLAGMIANSKAMTESDFDRWMEDAYFHMISDFIVAVTLAETAFAQEVSDRWISTGEERYVTAGISCYSWLIGSRPDSEFDCDKILGILNKIQETIHEQPKRVKSAMKTFIISAGISYEPLHQEILEIASAVDENEVSRGNAKCGDPTIFGKIKRETDKGRLGFKRKNVRC